MHWQICRKGGIFVSTFFSTLPLSQTACPCPRCPPCPPCPPCPCPPCPRSSLCLAAFLLVELRFHIPPPPSPPPPMQRALVLAVLAPLCAAQSDASLAGDDECAAEGCALNALQTRGQQARSHVYWMLFLATKSDTGVSCFSFPCGFPVESSKTVPSKRHNPYGVKPTWLLPFPLASLKTCPSHPSKQATQKPPSTRRPLAVKATCKAIRYGDGPLSQTSALSSFLLERGGSA